MRVELLYFDDCPSWQTALDNLRTALAGLSLSAEVRLTRVETDAQAVERRFIGSPTLRVNGEDLFPTGHDDYALGCRVYATPEGLRGWPTLEMVRTALEEREELFG
jgi:hypothetical protein